MCVDKKKELAVPHMNTIDVRDKNHRALVVGKFCTAMIDGHPHKAKIITARTSGCVVLDDRGCKHLLPWKQIQNIMRTY